MVQTFQIGEKIKWEIGQAKVIIKGLFMQVLSNGKTQVKMYSFGGRLTSRTLELDPTVKIEKDND